MHVVARRPHRELHRAAQKFKLRHYFLLTRVTRIFQKSVFTKAAPSSPGKTPLPGFFVAHRERRRMRVRAQPSRAGAGRGRSLPCFGVALCNGFYNLNVLAAAALAPGASCFLLTRSDELSP